MIPKTTHYAATFCIHTLGCKVNQYESEQIRQMLLESGCVEFDENASTQTVESLPESLPKSSLDIALVNSCGVTSMSEAKSRHLVRQLMKRHAPRRMLIFGCAAENNPEQFEKIDASCHVVSSAAFGGNRVAAVANALQIPTQPWGSTMSNGLRAFGERHRAFIKVQDGCRQFCTYCLISRLRRELSSVPMEEVCAEAMSLLQNGYRELVVTGIHLGYYGFHKRSRLLTLWSSNERNESRDENLPLLMDRLARLPFDEPFRLRISSLEAHEADDALLQVMKEHHDRICPHLHLSMQSGSPAVLRRMNRPGTIEEYLERIEAAKKRLDKPALTTDIIVGFPGETEKEFLETCDAARAAGFSKIHIFPFSPRPGTPAFEMGDTVPSVEKKRRVDFLATLEAELRAKYLKSIQNQLFEVLAERYHPEKGQLSGASQYYTQEFFPGEPCKIGTLCKFTKEASSCVSF
ncbi:MAG: MiaB/RimO family radical SAM methylthiotransferase [Planctomycetia bacterium]|nr:MiaB/RimO family radical SAM methylthiotransferase [Planctomycetia bacterium]